MSDGEAVTFKAVELDHPELGPEAQASPQVDPPQTSALPQPQNWTDSRVAAGQWSSAMDQFKLKRFFVLRPGTLNQALQDIHALVDPKEDGPVQSAWLMAEREEDGVRVFWDRLREPSFATRWNPFATDYPFSTFTYHPVRNTDEKFTALCEIQTFREKLTEAAQKAHLRKPIPGKANGVLVLNQPLLIEAYVGLMSFIGNQNKLGYSLARGNIGF
uniref:HSac2 domain-containing protein n=1 Tax=Esox lucius TaxID=8010 RepID=A0AAY5KC38_ESOLU